jgi:hypothetical protein
MKHEKNPLTEVPGGVTLKFEYENGQVKIQNNIKYPKKYIERVKTENELKGNILEAVIDVTNKKIIYQK